MERLPWALDLAAFFARRMILRQRVPLLVSFKLTYRCNLACRACPFHFRADSGAADMPWETAIGALDALRVNGARIVVFEGGEPFMWRDGNRHLNDLVDYARLHFLRVAVTTNGTFALDARADTLWVSLDGTKPTHDALRSGSFDRVYANLQATKHPRVFLHCTLNRRNISDIEALVRLASDLPTVRGITFQFFYPYSQGEEDLALSLNDRKTAIARLLSLKKAGAPIMNSASRLYAMIDNRWRCHDDLLVNVDPDGAISTGCYVKSRGVINCAACGFTPVAEASGALDLRPGSILAGWKLFLQK